MSIFARALLGCIVSLWGTHAFAGDLALDLGDFLFETESYEEAVTEYKRFVFFNPTSDRASYAHYKIGMAYRNQRRWTESIKALEQSVDTAHTARGREERELALAAILIASGNYSGGEFTLLRLESFSQYPILRRKAAFLRGVACLYLSRWKEAREVFRAYFSEGATDEFPKDVGIRVDHALAQAENLRYKSSSLARLLSTFLPGSGQIYANDWRSGLNAFVVNTGIFYLVFGNLAGGDSQDALISFLIFGRYYFGNRLRAGQAAERYNKHLDQIWRRRILRILANDLQ